jgi:hypothetical protein
MLVNAEDQTASKLHLGSAPNAPARDDALRLVPRSKHDTAPLRPQTHDCYGREELGNVRDTSINMPTGLHSTTPRQPSAPPRRHPRPHLS